MNDNTTDDDTQQREEAPAPELVAETQASDVSQESRNLTLLMWIGTIFFGFIPSLIIYLVKKDDAYIAAQAKEALNWSITVAIGYFGGLLLTIILIGPLIMLAVGICNLIFSVLGAIACSKGDQYQVPWTLRLLK